MSDPDRNPQFRRNWTAPPLKLKHPPLGGTSERADNFKDNSSEFSNTESDAQNQVISRGWP